jgi:hypothetical protein
MPGRETGWRTEKNGVEPGAAGGGLDGIWGGRKRLVGTRWNPHDNCYRCDGEGR